MSRVICNNCRHVTEASPRELAPATERPPCPNCGSLVREYQQTIIDAVAVVDEAEHAAWAQASAHVSTQATGQRIITDPTVYRRQRWTRLPGPAGRWLVEAIGDDGELLDVGMGDNEDDILLGIIDSLRPPTTD
jgi:hypothetical protein